MFDYDKLPESLRGGMRRYMENGVETGGFLKAVLENDLKAAVSRADVFNQSQIANIVGWLFNEAPVNSWGSPVDVIKWMKRGGMAGVDR